MERGNAEVRHESRLTEAQHRALADICLRYQVEFDEDDYYPAFDLPEGWVNGWVGGVNHNGNKPGVKQTIYIGVSPEGEVHS